MGGLAARPRLVSNSYWVTLSLNLLCSGDSRCGCHTQFLPVLQSFKTSQESFYIFCLFCLLSGYVFLLTLISQWVTSVCLWGVDDTTNTCLCGSHSCSVSKTFSRVPASQRWLLSWVWLCRPGWFSTVWHRLASNSWPSSCVRVL